MKICRNVAKYLAHPKFFTVLEAIEYAQTSGEINDWERILARKDLDPEIAYQHARILNRNKIWKVIAKREDVPLHAIWNIGKEIGSITLWEVIISRPDVDFETALEVSLTYPGVLNLWKITLTQKGAEPDVVVKKAEEIKESDVWSSILTQSSVISYFENMTLPLILPYLISCDDLVLWRIVMSKKDWVLPKDILIYAKKACSHEVWELALSKEEVIKYLRVQTPDELIKLAVEINCFELWSMILRRIDIKPEVVLSCLKYVKEDKVWGVVFRREDVHAYLNSLTPDKTLLLAEEIGQNMIWREGRIQANILGYIKTMDKKEALLLVSKICNVRLKEIILAREDIPINEVIECVKLDENKEAWPTVIKRSDFTKFLNKLKKPDAIAFAKECKSDRIWSLVLNKKNVKPEDSILLGKTFEDASIWDIILSLPSVDAYLKEEKS